MVVLTQNEIKQIEKHIDLEGGSFKSFWKTLKKVYKNPIVKKVLTHIPIVSDVVKGVDDVVDIKKIIGGKQLSGGKIYSGGKIVSGGKAKNQKPNAWITYVKAYALEHKITYKQALKEAKDTYKK